MKSGDLDRARHADPAEVVAGQVDEHHVLGALLRVGEQLLGQPDVLLRRSPRGAGCRPAGGRRPASPVTVTSASGEEPTTSNGRLPAGEAQQVHVRRRVGRPQHPVEVERVDRRSASSNRWASTTWKASPARMCSRIRSTPSSNTPGRQVAGAPAAASAGVEHAPRPGGTALRQVGGHRVEPGDGVVVRRSTRRRRSALAMSSTVPSVWSSTARSVTSIIASSGMPRSSALVSRQPLQPADDVVAEVADQPAGQRRQARGARRPRSRRARVADGGQRVGRQVVGEPGHGVAQPLGDAVPLGQHAGAADAHEAVPRPPLALLGRLEQHRARPVAGELAVDADGGLAVGQQPAGHRHDRRSSAANSSRRRAW